MRPYLALDCLTLKVKNCDQQSCCTGLSPDGLLGVIKQAARPWMQAQQLKREVQRRLGVDIQTNQYEDVSAFLQTALRSLLLCPAIM